MIVLLLTAMIALDKCLKVYEQKRCLIYTLKNVNLDSTTGEKICIKSCSKYLEMSPLSCHDPF